MTNAASAPDAQEAARRNARRRARMQAAAQRIDGRRREGIAALVAALEPALDDEALQRAIDAAAPSRAARAKLLRELEADPDALTSDVSGASRAAGRLALALIAAGAARVMAPRCPGCGEVGELRKPGPEGRVCEACYNRARTADCARCGRHRRIAGRDEDGGALCSSCRARDHANRTPCSRCGRVAPVNTRTAAGEPLCGSCYEAPRARCDHCGELGPINSRKGGLAVCQRCYRSPRRRCGRCGRIRAISLRARDGQPDLCGACHWAPVVRCTRCGQEAPGFGVRRGSPVCLHCSAAAKLDALIAGPDGEIPAALAGVREAFLAAQQPRSIHAWLDRSPGRLILRQLARGELELTHQALDALPSTPSLEHLRALLIAAGALPERDPHLARLERSTRELADAVGHPEDRRLLRAYLTWRVLHRLRRHAGREPISPLAANSTRERIAAIARLLNWLHERGRSLAELTQPELDHWLANGPARRRDDLRPFLAWAARRGAAPNLAIPGHRGSAPTKSTDAEHRWTLARRLLRDETLDVGDRAAGALVLLYAQRLSRIARLRTSDLQRDGDRLFLALGREPVLVPEPLAELLQRLPTRRQVGPSGTVAAAAQWLFPGRQAGQPQHPEHLRRRLARLGIDAQGLRNAALLHLAAEVPAAVLADTLGMDARTAVRWGKKAGGDWARYAARRARDQPDHSARRLAR